MTAINTIPSQYSDIKTVNELLSASQNKIELTKRNGVQTDNFSSQSESITGRQEYKTWQKKKNEQPSSTE